VNSLPNVFSREISTSLSVRSATADDLQEILELLAQMHDETAPAEEVGRTETFRRVLASPSRALLVATHEHEVVGTLDLYVIDNLTRGGRPWAGIENLVVDREHRRHGIGGALVDVALDLAASAGCYKVQLVSHERRTEAHDLYRQRGFDAPVHGYRRYLDR
jgi:GNAT superfamily N-acetyltransferase